MKRMFSIIVALAFFALPAPHAAASNCSSDEYNHNGSVMLMQICDGGSVTIEYVRPRSGIAAQGVRQGTLLFDGVEQAGGVVSGQARIFSSRCGAITYPVRGSNQGSSITLRGRAPVRDKQCRVVNQRADTLVFSLLGGAPQVVQPSCPAGFVFTQGQCVRASNPGPAPRPTPAAGDWYAIAGSFGAQRQAQSRANELGSGWYVINTRQCPNMRNGYWIATAGPSGRTQAQSNASRASHHGAYVKTCN